VSIDIFSLGALTYAVVSGKHPAADPDELIEKCRSGPGLRVSEAMDGAPDSLQELIQFTTEISPADRPATVQEFLSLLEQVEDDLTAPEPVLGVSPIHANKGDQLTGGFTVIQRLGSGSTCVALAVERGGGGQSGVLKVAKESALNERVRAEATVLKELRHPNIVKSLGEFEIDGLAAIFMERAGEKTLDQRLRTEGRLSLDLLERFGDELLSTLIYLEREGVNHRDIKPVNIGIGETRKRALTLKLFDFSLSRTPPDNIRAGTPPYLDPFLSLRKPARWDLYAERFAAAMTLYELATGVLPGWGDNGADALTTTDNVRLDTELLDPSVRDGLRRFFSTALHRDYRKRYDNADEMHLAWREVFQEIDRPTTDETDTETGESLLDLSSIDDLSRSTKLSAMGLSARELNAADRIGATTVGELLDLPGIRMYRNRGIGQRVIRQLRNLREQLAARLSVQPAAPDEGDEPPDQLSIERLVDKLISIKLGESDVSLLRAWLGLDERGVGKAPELPTLREAAEHSACAMPHAQSVIERAVEKWSKSSWMTVARDEIADFLQRKEGIATVEEAAIRLLGVRGSSAEGATRMRRALAVVQAAVEAESTRESARFILYRGPTVALVVATEQLGARFADTPAARAKYVEGLAHAAQVLAREDPLPSARRIDEQLNAVPAPRRRPRRRTWRFQVVSSYTRAACLQSGRSGLDRTRCWDPNASPSSSSTAASKAGSRMPSRSPVAPSSTSCCARPRFRSNGTLPRTFCRPAMRRRLAARASPVIPARSGASRRRRLRKSRAPRPCQPSASRRHYSERCETAAC
jgi:serine/threonine protein kinase